MFTYNLTPKCLHSTFMVLIGRKLAFLVLIYCFFLHYIVIPPPPKISACRCGALPPRGLSCWGPGRVGGPWSPGGRGRLGGQSPGPPRPWIPRSASCRNWGRRNWPIRTTSVCSTSSSCALDACWTDLVKTDQRNQLLWRLITPVTVDLSLADLLEDSSTVPAALLKCRNRENLPRVFFSWTMNNFETTTKCCQMQVCQQSYCIISSSLNKRLWVSCWIAAVCDATIVNTLFCQHLLKPNFHEPKL